MKSLRIMSPGSLVLIAGVLMVAFTFMPPATYEYYMREPSLMLGNPLLYLFIIGCMLVIWMGALIALRMPHPRVCLRSGWERVPLVPVMYFAIPVLFSCGLLVLTVKTVLANDPYILVLALSGMGSEVKRAAGEASQGAFSGSLPLAMGVAWWTFAQYLKNRYVLSRRQSFVVASMLAVLTVSLLLAATLLMARFVIMPALFGLALIYIRHKVADQRQNIASIVPKALMAVGIILAVFGLFSYFRTGGDGFYVVRSYIGYGPASVNHLAALLEGRFNLEALYGYLSQENFGFVLQFPLISRFTEGSADFSDNFYASFSQTWAAGLNGGFNWFTAIGAIYGQLGALAIPYLLMVGYLLGRLWKSFCAGGAMGITVYPWFAFALIFCFGSQMFGKNFTSMLLLLGIIMAGYSAVASLRVTR